jgi:prepilin-type N-terminal cleavage/methylation domain-containing protein
VDKNNGFTMIEATIAMVVLVIAAAGILLPFTNAAAVQTESCRQVMAASLASELMEIIEASTYSDILTTYNSYSEADGALLDAAGATHSDRAYDGFSRTAACQTASVGAVNMIAATVTVYHDGRKVTKITTLIGNHE